MDEDLLQLGIFMLFVVGFIVVRLISSASKKAEKKRFMSSVVDFSNEEPFRAPSYTTHMPGDYVTPPPPPASPASVADCLRNTAGKTRSGNASARPSRKSLKAPSDIREAIVWGEILKRKF